MNSDIIYIKTAQRQLGIHDEDYRAMISRVTGNPDIKSAKELSITQAQAVKQELRRLGFKPKPQSNSRKNMVRAIRFLWLQLGEAKCLDDRSKTAMWAFVGARTKNGNGFKASLGELHQCVQALKGWCEREGVSTGNL